MDVKKQEFLKLFIEAKKLEKEAFSCFIPESLKGHMNVIEKEVKAMALELFFSSASKESENTKQEDCNFTKTKKQEQSKVKKVEIG